MNIDVQIAKSAMSNVFCLDCHVIFWKLVFVCMDLLENYDMDVMHVIKVQLKTQEASWGEYAVYIVMPEFDVPLHTRTLSM